jgi:hypothetical protein
VNNTQKCLYFIVEQHMSSKRLTYLRLQSNCPNFFFFQILPKFGLSIQTLIKSIQDQISRNFFQLEPNLYKWTERWADIKKLVGAFSKCAKTHVLTILNPLVTTLTTSCNIYKPCSLIIVLLIRFG